MGCGASRPRSTQAAEGSPARRPQPLPSSPSVKNLRGSGSTGFVIEAEMNNPGELQQARLAPSERLASSLRTQSSEPEMIKTLSHGGFDMTASAA